MPLISLDDDDQRWVPTHVNVVVLRARGLRTKGKQGSRYVYTVIQVGKEKYTTGLVEKAVEPEWNEECAFELLPGLLDADSAAARPPGCGSLIFTVMHRVLIGLDVFLGQAILPLDKIFQDGTCPRNEWVKLHSKVGRKDKERGELQVTIRFTRNNMTASMYDLTVKDKPRSAFGRLKDRVTGKKRVDVESSSAILPGRYAALSGSTSQNFQEDGGDGFGEDPGVEERGEERRSKMKDFFLKGKLRKGSDTRSCSSLASESSAASSTSDPFVPIELCSTPVYSSRVMEPFRADSDGGVKDSEFPMTHKRAHSDEATKITPALWRCPAVETIKGQSMPLSKSTLCINGTHVYSSEPVYSKSPAGLPVKRTLLEKCSPLSRSLQNLTRRSEDPQKADGRRWSIDKSKKEAEGEAQAQEGSTSEGKPVQVTAPLVVATGSTEAVDKGKKLRKTLFSSGRSDSLPAKPEQSQTSGSQEGRLRGWFGSGDSQNKPRLEVSPKVESSPDTSSSLPPCFPNPPPGSLPLVSAPTRMSPSSVSHPTNPFTHPLPQPPSISPTNPFLTRLQRNPFFEELLAEEALKSPTEMYYPSSPFGHYPAFPAARHGLASPAHDGALTKMTSIRRERPRSVARQRSLPALMPGTPDAPTVNSNSTIANRPFSDSNKECDDFEVFATNRLKSPVATPAQPLSSPVTAPSQHKSGIAIDRVNEGIPKQCDLPPLPPRRLARTPVLAWERSSDSWLDRAQELAVLKEACVLYQTDLASLQHARGTNAQVSPLNKESFMFLNATDLGQNSDECQRSPTAPIPRNGNINTVEIGEERVWGERGLSPNPIASCGMELIGNGPMFGLTENVRLNNPSFVYEGIQENSVNSTSDHTVPNTPFCLSDCDTTVSESLSFQPLPKDEFPCDPNSKADQHNENLAPSGDVAAHALGIRDSNNNTNDPSQFAFIDSDSTPSDGIQNSFVMVHKDGKAQVQCQDVSSSNYPQLFQNTMTGEFDMLALNNSSVHKDIISPRDATATVMPNNNHLKTSLLEKPCDVGHNSSVTHPKEGQSDLKDVSYALISTPLPTNSKVGAESEGSDHKEGSVAPQTASSPHSDDDNATAQLQPEASEDNVGSDALHEGGDCGTYDALKTGTAEVKTEEKDCKSNEISQSHLTLTEGISFEDLHARVAPKGSRSPSKPEIRSARIRTRSTANSPKTDPSTVLSTHVGLAKPPSLSDILLHNSTSLSLSAPASVLSQPNPVADLHLTSTTHSLTTSPGLGSTPAVTQSNTSGDQSSLFPEEAKSDASLPPAEESSPHPVKPLTNTAQQTERKSESRSVLEKIRSSIQPGRSVQQTSAEPEKSQQLWMAKARAHYQTLTNMELIALLLQQEMDVAEQRAESELQATLLEKREAELKKMKVQVRDLEDYIDKLLVRIMEQTPTLLQVRARPK